MITPRPPGGSAFGLDVATASLLEQAWAKLEEASYTKNNTNKEQVMRALEEHAGVKVDIDNLTILTFSDLAAFGQEENDRVTEAGLVGSSPATYLNRLFWLVPSVSSSARDLSVAWAGA